MAKQREFEDHYTYDGSIESVEFLDQEGMFETFGQDMQTVLEVHEQTPRRVWTAMDGDDGVYLVNGLHYVNRVYYVITVEEGEEGEEFLDMAYGEDDEDDSNYLDNDLDMDDDNY
jgi:hypothetical protein